MRTLRDVTEEIEQIEAARSAVPHDSPKITPSLRRAIVADMERRMLALRAEQEALMVGAIIAIGVEEDSW